MSRTNTREAGVGTLGDDVTAWETWLDGPIVLPGGQNGFNLSDLGVIWRGPRARAG
jgi:hypothetical protein